jgi:hypothetical protein
VKRFLPLAGLAGLAIAVGTFGTVQVGNTSSHREAPAISLDATADATDLYAFRSPDAPDTVTFIANYIPMQPPASGPNFGRFADNVLYEINIDNDGDAIEDITYQFRFRSEVNSANPFNQNTFLYNTGPVTSIDDPDLNQRQFYSVSVLSGEGGSARAGTLLAEDIPVAPADVGPTSFPDDSYGTVASQAVTTIGDGVKVFAGPRDDPFFVDLGGVFDLLSVGGGVDYVAGLNVHTIAIQVPIDQLTADGQMPSGVDDPDAIVGIRTTSYRQGVTVLRELGGQGDANTTGALNRGPWVQVSRLDLPLINEVVIPLKDKDRWNGSRPKNDTQFLGYVTGTAPGSTAEAAPHLGALLNIVLGVNVPPAPRNDLVDALLLGLPGLNRPADVVASSQLRLNMAVPVAEAPNRLGAVGGDLQGFPNGRRLTDDVTDIELAAIAGCLMGGDFADNCALGDAVDANDRPFMAAFPYLAPPHDYAD